MKRICAIEGNPKYCKYFFSANLTCSKFKKHLKLEKNILGILHAVACTECIICGELLQGE